MLVQTTYIHPKALRIGLFVRLEMGWTLHPFSFNNFLLRDAGQVRQLQALGLDRVLCDVERSETEALKTAAADSAAAPPEAPSAAAPAPIPHATPHSDAALAAALTAKTQRLARLKTQVGQLDVAEKSFNAAMREMGLVTQNLFSLPGESVRRAKQIVEGLLGSMADMENVRLHLMNNKLNSREQYEHELNVASLVLLLGRRLNLPDPMLRELGLASLFHDAGKREMAESLTRKVGMLSSAERDALQQHVTRSVSIGREMVLGGAVVAAIAQHHEMADGSGHPQQLTLVAIDRKAQLLALVNAFDNLCNPPHQMTGLTPHEALKVLFARERKRFAPDALAAFIRMLGIYPPGTLVQLKDGSPALVLSVAPQDALRPTLLVYEAGATRSDSVIVDLLEEPELSIVRGLQRQELSMEAAAYLNPRRRVSYFASDGASA
jgi:HD-GYP domain-containing protein (c-di-GMP phosphodiesterase class II)